MKHLLGINELSTDEIEDYLEHAKFYADSLENGSWDKNKLHNKIILTLFFENSTRTLTSFDIASKRLGANTVVWHPKISSVHKDESFTDTIDTLSEMKPDAIVIRHSEYGAPSFVANRVNCPVINGGDSWHEHPTQALLDALTMIQEKKTLEGLNVALCGDVAHSRVANSNAHLLKKMGAQVKVIAPEFLIPHDPKGAFPLDGIEKFTSMEEGLPGTDVIMMLRIQKERMDKSLIPDTQTYFKDFGLTQERLKIAKKDVIVMHPGPMNRGIEIADDVADDPRHSMISRQVANGIPTRMAVLDMLIGG
ncbi:MAG: aspartate carbamoyltransferase catalytic subunit [Alphaproteobacteria bacterium]|nr:aspartate carbamoyltransferase catalytic subunit [Alphaproteobacteria bacterium]